MRVINVVGARPNFMKIAPIHLEMVNDPGSFQAFLLHTGQHYDERMSRMFFQDLRLPEPDAYLGVGSGSHAVQTAAVMTQFESICQNQKPDLVVVVGDVNSTLACSLVSAKLNIPVAHVEAGLRSFDRTMPEEINRIVTDSISELLFTTEASAEENLRREGVPANKIRLVGNVMIDSIRLFAEPFLQSLSDPLGEKSDPYAVLTLHRPSNVDGENSLAKIVSILETVQERVDIVFPIHPRTKQSLESFAFFGRLQQLPRIRMVDPMGYVEFMQLMKKARFVMTDSGGIQEETTYFGIPCLTLRENTERPVTIADGTNALVGTDKEKIDRAVSDILDGSWKRGSIPALWDGHAAGRIVSELKTWQNL